jgi:hypothetical protein
MTEAINEAARALAAARHAAGSAAEAVIEAQGAADKPKQRVATIQAERASIIAASRVGNPDPEMALRLAVLDADLADLGQMVAEAEAELAKVKTAAEQAKQVVVSAEQYMTRATDDEMARVLAIHASALDTLLLATINDMRGLATRGARRPWWAPSEALVTELQRLHLTAGIRR